MQVSQLSDTALLASLQTVLQRSRHGTVDLLQHLAEVELRDLHLARGFSSMFAYCTDSLGFEKSAAYNRIAVARLSRRFPRVLVMVGSGELTLTAARTLGPHLAPNPEDADDLLAAAAGKTVDQIQVLLAERYPKPSVPTTIRKRPTASASKSSASSAMPLFEAPRRGPEAVTPRPEPIAKDSYKVTFTASAELVGMLEEVTALMTQADGHKRDEADVLEAAVRELRDRLRKRKYAVGARPGKKGRATGETRNRRIPNAVRREVAERDGFQCAYVDRESGRRCCEQRWLEFQHHEAFSRGGEHSVENLSLYCRAHNQWAGRRDGLIRRRPGRAVETAAGGGRVDSLGTAEQRALW